MTDPLAQYRRKPLGVGAESMTPKGPDGYVAFDAKDKVDRLLIRSAKVQERSPGYVYLLDIASDGPYGTNFVLYYSFMMTVLVEGRNLQPVIKAVRMGTADFIQEFDPEKWSKPTDEKAPFIESIQLVVEQGGPPSPDGKKSGNKKASDFNLH